MWSHSTSGNTIDAVNVTVNSASLLFQYIAPSDLEPVPRQMSYSYFNLTPFSISSAVPLASNAQTVLTSQALQLNGVPRRMYIFVRERDSDLTFKTSDVFLSLDQVTVTFDTNNYLASATPQALYHIAVKNGSTLSWPQWSSFVGGILCLDFATDIGLPPTQAPGSLGSHSLIVNVRSTNLNQTRALVPILYLVIVSDGMINIIDGSVIRQEYPLLPKDVLNAREMTGVTFKRAEAIHGGDFFSDIGDFFTQTVPRAAERALPYIGKAAEIAAPFLIQKALGGRRGGTYSGSGSVISGGRHRRARMITGGAIEEEKAESEYSEEESGPEASGDEKSGGASREVTEYFDDRARRQSYAPREIERLLYR